MRLNPKFWNDFPIVPTEPDVDHDDSSSDSDMTVEGSKTADDNKSQPTKITSSAKPSQIRVGSRYMNVDHKKDSTIKSIKDKDPYRCSNITLESTDSMKTLKVSRLSIRIRRTIRSQT